MLKTADLLLLSACFVVTAAQSPTVTVVVNDSYTPAPITACDPKALPKFSDFPVALETIDAPKLDLSSHPIGRQFRTRLRKAARTQPPNLAGHFLLTGWGCGSGCQMFAIINLRNGRIWHNKFEVLSRGASSQPDSELVVLNEGAAPAPGFPPTRYLRWTGNTLKPLCQHLEIDSQQ